MQPSARFVIGLALGLGAAVPAHAQTPSPSTLAPPLRALVESLRDTSLARQLAGAYGLGQLGSRAAPAVPFLFEVLQRYDGMTEVDSSLLKYFDKRTSFLFANGKANAINPAQIVASASLAQIGRPAVPAIQAALVSADPTELFFPYLTDALAGMTDSAADAVLYKLIRDPRLHARSRVASSLGLRTDPASLDTLIAMLADSSRIVRDDATVSLQRRTGQKFGESVAKWREWRATRPPL